jgi:hypothetical protein
VHSDEDRDSAHNVSLSHSFSRAFKSVPTARRALIVVVSGFTCWASGTRWSIVSGAGTVRRVRSGSSRDSTGDSTA